MTVNSQANTVTFTGNGVTTVFPYTFRIPEGEMGHVGLFDIATNTLLEIDPSDYSISGVGSDFGGAVTYNPMGGPIPSTKRIVIYRELDLVQELDLTNQTPYFADTLEETLDRVIMMMQQVNEAAGRAIKVTLGSDLTPDEFVEDLQGGAAEAQASAAVATAAAVAAAASAASINLPSPAVALNILRVNAGATGYELRTPAQVRADISAASTATLAALDARVVLAEAAIAALQAYNVPFVSGQQTIVYNGGLTLPHGLGAKPKRLFFLLHCTSATSGYSVGDEPVISMGAQSTFTAVDGNIGAWADATNINIRFPTRVDYTHKTTGLLVTLDVTKWTLIAIALP